MRKLKKHIFTHANNIVVGGDVASLLWALKEDYWIAFTEPRKPLPFERLNTGDPTQALWEFLALQLNYRGKILGATPNQSIRADGDILKIITKNGSLLNYKFDQLVITNPEMFEGGRIKEALDRKMFVVDTVRMSAQPHNHTYYYHGQDFVNEIHFWLHGKRKTLEVVSYLRESELDIFEHSWVPMRYTLLDIARDLGLKGMKGGGTRTYPLRFDYKKRLVRPTENHIYYDEDKIKFITVNENELWNEQTRTIWQKWSESFRWTDTEMTNSFRTHLGSSH